MKQREVPRASLVGSSVRTEEAQERAMKRFSSAGPPAGTQSSQNGRGPREGNETTVIWTYGFTLTAGQNGRGPREGNETPVKGIPATCRANSSERKRPKRGQ